MTQILQQFTGNIVVIVMAVIALVLGIFSVSYLNKRRQMLHQERMATLIKGLHYAGVAKDIFSKPSTAPVTTTATSTAKKYLIKGLQWLLGALGIAGAAFGVGTLQLGQSPVQASHMAIVGVVPAAISISHFISSFLTRKKKPTAIVPVRRYYRVGQS